MMKCTECKACKYETKKVPYIFLGENIGSFDALVCNNCDETLFESDASDKIEAKRRGLWGLRVRSKVSKVGNALDVRISKTIADFLALKKSQEVIIEPIDRTKLQIVIA